MNGNPQIHRNVKASETGSVVVEFALIIPLFFVLVFGVVEFGRVLMVNHSLTHAAREGARMGVLHNATAAQVIGRIDTYLDACGIEGETVTLTPSDPTAVASDQPVGVSVSIPYESIAWIPGSFAGLAGKTLERSCIMRKEGW